MKSIQVNQQTLEAITKHGARTMLLVIDEDDIVINNSLGIIVKDLPLQVDDEFFLAESFSFTGSDGEFEYFYVGDAGYSFEDSCEAEDMRESQSRFKGKTLSVEVKRVQSLTWMDVRKLTAWKISEYNVGKIADDLQNDFIDWLKEQNIDYNENQLVGLINFKEMRW